MINSLIDSICEAINKEFGDGYEIYTESVEQGLKEPCFFVLCINPTHDLFLGKRYKRTHQFMIQYLPSANEINKECNEVKERLFYCLETIVVQGALTRGTKMNGETVDGVLNFSVNFDMFVYKDEPIVDNKMDSYGINASVRKEEENGK